MCYPTCKTSTTINCKTFPTKNCYIKAKRFILQDYHTLAKFSEKGETGRRTRIEDVVTKKSDVDKLAQAFIKQMRTNSFFN